MCCNCPSTLLTILCPFELFSKVGTNARGSDNIQKVGPRPLKRNLRNSQQALEQVQGPRDYRWMHEPRRCKSTETPFLMQGQNNSLKTLSIISCCSSPTHNHRLLRNYLPNTKEAMTALPPGTKLKPMIPQSRHEHQMWHSNNSLLTQPSTLMNSNQLKNVPQELLKQILKQSMFEFQKTSRVAMYPNLKLNITH